MQDLLMVLRYGDLETTVREAWRPSELSRVKDDDLKALGFS